MGRWACFLPPARGVSPNKQCSRRGASGERPPCQGSAGRLRNVLLGGGRCTGGPPTGSSFSLPPGIKIAERSLSLESHSAHPPLLPMPTSLAVPRRGRGKAGRGSRGPHRAGHHMASAPEEVGSPPLPREDVKVRRPESACRVTQWHGSGTTAAARGRRETRLPWPGSAALQLSTPSRWCRIPSYPRTGLGVQEIWIQKEYYCPAGH